LCRRAFVLFVSPFVSLRFQLNASRSLANLWCVRWLQNPDNRINEVFVQKEEKSPFPLWLRVVVLLVARAAAVVVVLVVKPFVVEEEEARRTTINY
jgi:hypothetical protein